MTLILSGSDGLSDVDGTAATPAIRGTDTNTGIFFPAADTIAFSEGGTESMRLDSSGNLGLGTTTPNQRLQVNTSAASGGQIQVTNASTGTTSTDGVLIGYDGSNDVIVNNQEATATKFFTSGSERMRVTSSGLVGIGTSSPSALLQVAGSSIFQDSMQIFNNPTSSAQGILFRNSFNVGASRFSMGPATTNGIIEFIGGNGTQGAITGNGAGISYTSASDYRLKENVTPMTNALGVVAQLKPCTYTWKYNGSAGQGFIAHELQEVVPEAVTGEKDAVDEDGNIKPQGIDTSFLVATLTAAIQELKAIVDAQAAEIQALKAK